MNQTDFARRLVLETMFQIWLRVHGFEEMTKAQFIVEQRKNRRFMLANSITCGCEICLDNATRLVLNAKMRKPKIQKSKIKNQK